MYETDAIFYLCDDLAQLAPDVSGAMYAMAYIVADWVA